MRIWIRISLENIDLPLIVLPLSPSPFPQLIFSLYHLPFSPTLSHMPDVNGRKFATVLFHLFTTVK